MKKSTILFLIVVYIAAFFVVGLIGISLRSHYEINYVTEILVEKMDNQPNLELAKSEREEIVSKDDPDHARYNNSYVYDVDYVKDLVLKFKVTVKPDNSTYSTFTIDNLPKETIAKVEKNEDSTIYVHVYKALTFSFQITSTDGNNLISKVQINAW